MTNAVSLLPGRHFADVVRVLVPEALFVRASADMWREVWSVVRREERSLDCLGGSDDPLGVPAARVVTEPVDRAGQADRGDHVAAVVHRRAHGCCAGGSLAYACGPSLAQRLRVTQQQPTGRTAFDREQGAERYCRAQFIARFDRNDGQTLLSTTHEQLAALSGVFGQLFEDRCRQLRQAGGAESGSANEQAVLVTTDEAVNLQGGQQPVRCRVGEGDRFLHLQQTDGLLQFDNIEQEHRLIHHTNTTDDEVHPGIVVQLSAPLSGTSN